MDTNSSPLRGKTKITVNEGYKGLAPNTTLEEKLKTNLLQLLWVQHKDLCPTKNNFVHSKTEILTETQYKPQWHRF